MIELVAALAVLAQVELRGLEAAPEGDVVGVDASGVALGIRGPDGTGSKPTLVIGWDRVRGVRGPFDRAAREWLQPGGVGERAWRARTRLERGDAISAGPMFEDLFRTYRGIPGPTTAVIAEGLLRCRLRVGAHVAAVEPWLALLDSTGEGPPRHRADWAGDAGLAPLMDPATGLVPAVPPMWAGPSAAQVISGLTLPEAKLNAAGAGPGRAGVLAALYVVAAKFEAGESVSVPELTSSDPGVQFVRQIVLARTGDAPQRDSARRALSARMPGPNTLGAAPDVSAWTEAWCRAAIGRSLLREDDPEQKRLGIVELLHLPARFDGAHPYLAGLALAESSVALREMGDDAGADVLLRELTDRHADHPVLLWEPIRSRASRSVARAAVPTSGPPAPEAGPK